MIQTPQERKSQRSKHHMRQTRPTFLGQRCRHDDVEARNELRDRSAVARLSPAYLALPGFAVVQM